MKILYHHRTTAQDGSAVHIEGLTSALRELGAHVEVIAPSLAAPGVGTSPARPLMAALRRSLPKSVHELGELAYNGTEAATLWLAVRRFAPDVIYQRSNLFLLSGSWIARRAGLPLIEEVNAPYFIERSRHGGMALPPIASWAERVALQRADAVVTVTSVLADIVSAQGVARERLHVMPNGIDESFLRPGAIDVNAKATLGLAGYTVLGFTGFVRAWNGLDVVLEQLALSEGQNWFLLIIGDGPARPALEARARQLGVQNRVRFTGVVKRADVPKFVSAFDVALQPAANPYASPLKLFEYMAMGRAIVAPDQPNIREILTDGHDALLFSHQNPRALGTAVQRLASDDGLRSRLAKSAVGTVKQRNLTWRHNAERVLALAERLVAARLPPSATSSGEPLRP